MPTDALLIDFCRANDLAGATTKKLVKQQVLGDYLASIKDDDDLRSAVRYCAGRAFSVTDARTLNAGGALVREVIVDLFKVAPAHLAERARAAGEYGEAIAGMMREQRALMEQQLSSEARQLSSEARQLSSEARQHLSDSQQHSSDSQRHSSDSQRHSYDVNQLRSDERAEGVTDQSTLSQQLTLAQVARAFEAMSGTGVREAKAGVLRGLLKQCVDPREAAYVVKIISGDLRTGVQEGVLQAAVARAFDQSLKAVQRCQLLVGDLDEVAVLARHGRCGEVTFRLFHPVQFMLATPQETAQEAAKTLAGRTFLAETKWDGIRAQVHKTGEGAEARVDIFTRTMDRIDAGFPEVVSALRQVPGEFLVDGEIVSYQDGKVLPFAHLQKRLGRVNVSTKVQRDYPVRFIAFDILYRDGRLLMDEPLRARRAELESWSSGETLLNGISEVCDAASINVAFDASRDAGNEGLILKDPESGYSAGRRGGAWLKLKTHLPTFDCVVTAAEYGHGKRRGTLSDYTFAVWDAEPDAPGAQLVNIGKAFSGVTDEEIARLTELFLSISVRQIGRTHLVEPKVVLEIACDQIQTSARHASGYALRFPRIKRVRWDKLPQDAERLKSIELIYQSSSNFGKSVTSPDALTELKEPAEPTLFDHLTA